MRNKVLQTTIHAIVICGFACSLAMNSTAVAGDVPDLSGVYQCNGRDSDGTAYSGQCTISKNGSVYHLRWEVLYSKSPTWLRYTGIGVPTENGMAVSWSGPQPSVASYELGANRVLNGRWALQGARTIQPETLMPLR